MDGGDDDPRLAYLPSPCPFSTVTPKGRIVRYPSEPLASEVAGYSTLAEILLAIDTECDAFEVAHPDVAGTTFRVPILLHDDYVYWVPNGYPNGSWAAGDTDMTTYVRVTIWTRVETAVDPSPAWIVRAPGFSFGTTYTAWRHTDRPFVPALQHEFGHVAYGPGYQHKISQASSQVYITQAGSP
jgi:hypothetical protein